MANGMDECGHQFDVVWLKGDHHGLVPKCSKCGDNKLNTDVSGWDIFQEQHVIG